MITNNLEMRRGDLKPDLIVDLDDGGLPVNLTAASVVNVIGVRNGVLLFKRPAEVLGDGGLLVEWEVSDTSAPGTIAIEVEIIWPGAKPQSVRAAGYVKVYPDLG